MSNKAALSAEKENAAVHQFLNTGTGIMRKPAGSSAYATQDNTGFSFGNITVFNANSFSTAPVSIQPKLTINQPGDQYEQEADTMADKVMRMPDFSANRRTFTTPAITMIQRKCANCEEEEKNIHRKASGTASTQTVSPAVEQTLHSAGQPLDHVTCSFMEQRFGHDFSKVRIHNDSLANQSSKDINALAYTNGNHVVFGAGQYQSGTSTGNHLLAHELTHVVQQNGGSGINTIQRDVIESDTSCAKEYPKGEVATLRNEQGVLDEDVIDAGGGELLIADFGVDWRHVKNSIQKNPVFKQWLSIFESDSSYQLSVNGYSDCVGEAGNNSYLRSLRAKNIVSLFSDSLKARTKIVGGAPADHYYTNNTAPVNRAKNRSVLISFQRSFDFEGDEIEGDKEKARFICGPDITDPLKQVISDTEKLFQGWSSDDKDDACDELDGYTTGDAAWDIVDLHHNDWIYKNFRPECATKGAKPECGSSVQVGDQCYYAGSVNYVIFGKMCNLCSKHYYDKGVYLTGVFRFTPKAMLDLIRLYKGPYGLSDPFSSSPSANYQKLKEWAYAGYMGWPNTGIPRGDKNNCTPYCPKPIDRSFKVHWAPKHNLETTRRDR